MESPLGRWSEGCGFGGISFSAIVKVMSFSCELNKASELQKFFRTEINIYTTSTTQAFPRGVNAGWWVKGIT